MTNNELYLILITLMFVLLGTILLFESIKRKQWHRFLNTCSETWLKQNLIADNHTVRIAELETSIKNQQLDIRELHFQAQNQLAEKLINFEKQTQAELQAQKSSLHEKIHRMEQQLSEVLFQNHKSNLANMADLKLSTLELLQNNLQTQMQDTRHQLLATLAQQSETINLRLDKLIEQTSQKLLEISGQVNERLAEGFEKTTATFADVVKRLALIDEAQKRITELSTNVVSLQEILSDKRARGAFGEVQLTALIRNVIPETNFRLQHTLSNGKRVDCILFLPEPSGNVAIDAKFPLESYRKLCDLQLNLVERKNAEQQFRIDIKKHILDIADKYIIANETSAGAIMFIPAEAVFAEIHAHYADLIDIAQKANVWIASPTTMMAILTTARAVLKDADTKKQVHLIQEHLGYLAKDFERFQKRMDNLAKHIQQAHEDVKDVNTSANKITSRFRRIENVQLESEVDSQINLLD